MKHLYILCLFLFISTWAFAQTPMKSFNAKPVIARKAFQPATNVPDILCNAREAGPLNLPGLHSLNVTNEAIQSVEITKAGSYWVTFESNQLWASRISVNELMGDIMPFTVFERNWSMSWESANAYKDERNIEHVRIKQFLAGHPILRQDMILHIEHGQLRDLNGFAWTGPTPDKLPVPLSSESAIDATRRYLIAQDVKFQSKPSLEGLHHASDEAFLNWLPTNGKLRLVYEVNVHPNMMDHWTAYVDASTLEVVEAYSQLCSIYPERLYDQHSNSNSHSNEITSGENDSDELISLVVDGP
ncbi:MAG: hypothetical protein M3R25_11620, partial [Bacteroidota bacterium]|nr:hypothetical protein [Bacteroidota bacterium]